MKKLNLIIVLLLVAIGTSAQHFDWATRGGLWAYDYGEGIAADVNGNVYIAGKYEMNAIFNGVTLPCQGNHDIYVAKYNSSGGLAWIRTAGGYSGDYAHAVATDSKFVYISGEIEGSNALIKFIGSPITLTCVGSNDVFVAKYDLYGNLLWARRGGGWDNEKATGVAYDYAGNIYVCGYFYSYATFGNITVNGAGNEDIFIVKYDPNGNVLWARSAGSGGRDEPHAIKCDANGDVYLCGMYKSGCNFSGQVLSAPNGYSNCFLAKYSSSGTVQWVRTGGGNYDDVGWGIAMDNYGKIFMSGEFNATANFSGLNIYTTGSADVFVACYTSAGNIAWIKKAGGSLVDRARSIGCDGNNLYITGQFGGTAYFGPYYRTAADNSDIFIAALNNSGQFLWANSAGGPADAAEDLGFESGIAVCATPYGEVYATGSMLNGASFGSTYLSAYARTDVFLTKLRNGVAAREAEELPMASADVKLEGKSIDNKVTLTWIYSGDGKKDMALDKSIDGINFTELKYYQAEEIKDNTVNYTDITADKISKAQYRVRIIDQDGVTSFSRVLNITPAENAGAGIEIFPSPARTELGINITGHSDKKVRVSIYDAGGREIWTREMESESCKVDVSPWSRGIYVLVMRNDEAVLSRQKIVIE